MDKHIITVSQPDISIAALLSALHMDEDSDMLAEITQMLDAALQIAQPIALYQPLIPERKDGEIWLNGIRFKEPFVHKMLSGAEVVVPFVASCGLELEAWSRTFTDFFDEFVADTIKMLCLGAVRAKLFSEVQQKYFDTSKNISSINPGSLKEWPIIAQTPLFAALGGVTEDIGVVLSKSLLMSPTKSVSGILFQSEEAYENCQLCPKIECPGRRAPYLGD